jgi:hypothetical protein
MIEGVLWEDNCIRRSVPIRGYLRLVFVQDRRSLLHIDLRDCSLRLRAAVLRNYWGAEHCKF